MITAARLDLSAFQNADWSEHFIITDAGVELDLTGWGLQMQVRAQEGQTGAPLATAALTATALELAAGEFTMSLSTAVLEAMLSAPVVYPQRTIFYDLVATLPDASRRVLLFGQFILKPGVTR